jgi:membrane protein DedA with SNARE-associated domain
LDLSPDHLLHVYGYFVVVAAVAVESVGIPIPGETLLIAAAIYAQSTGHLSIVWLIVLAAAAAIMGDNVGYALGRWGGEPFLRKHGRRLHVDEKKLKVARYLFREHGGKVVFFGRFVSILRTYAAFLAGVSRMHWRSFLVYNALGGALWATAFGLAAYFAGRGFESTHGIIDVVVGVVAVAIVVSLFIFLRRRGKELERKAEQEMPGRL